MASCEKCWNDALSMAEHDPFKSQAEWYDYLIQERKDNPCTPEQQAGIGATECKGCKKASVHQIIRICMNCGLSHDGEFIIIGHCDV